MQLLYGTSNQGKLAAMRRALKALPDIELIGLKEIKAQLLKTRRKTESAGKEADFPVILPEIEETGSTPLENARLKALAYYDALKIPVFSCDTGLYFDGLPEELQPGVHVRTIQGRRLTDEEMTAYYAGLARQYGPLTARFKNAVCFVLDETHIYESMDGSLSGLPFLLVDTPHPEGYREKGFPLDCLTKNITTGEYYYDMGENCEDNVAHDKGFYNFFKSILEHQTGFPRP